MQRSGRGERSAGVHRWIVEALGDATALGQLEPDGFLPLEPWEAAVERVRIERFGDRSPWSGALEVGTFVARRFLASESGVLMRELLGIMSLDRALEMVVLPITERLRRSAEFDFKRDPGGGGRVEIRGQFVVGEATMIGFLQGIIELIPGQYTVRLASRGLDWMALDIKPFET